MSGLSGKKYSIFKIQDPPSEKVSRETTQTIGTNPMYNNPRSGKKYLPVRISTANFDNLSGSKTSASNRKTMDLSSRKPIRNIHKLFESPKKTVRKRLDNLYDYSKPKENSNANTMRAQPLSGKKLAPKTPDIITSDKKPISKTSLFMSGNKSRRSRLLPPGTITGSYVKGRNPSMPKTSLAPRTALYEPTNNRLTVVHKNLQTKRPSDVLEESPQPLESYISSDDAEKLPLQNCTINKSLEALKGIGKNGLKKIDQQTSPLINPDNDTGKLIYCCKCSSAIQNSSQSKDTVKAADTNINILVNSEEIIQKDLLSSEDNMQGAFQRPTVIVMPKETAPQLTVEYLDEFVQIPVQDGSYSEILNLQPSANNSAADESVLFKRMEKACGQLENIQELKGGDDDISQSIFELINTSREVLVKQQSFLTKSISESEKNLKNLKLALKNVDAQLNNHEILASNLKLKGWSNFENEELSLAVKNKLKKNLIAQSLDNSCKTSLQEDLESGEKTNQPKGKRKQRKSRSGNVEESLEEKGGENLPEDRSKESNQGDDRKENIENEPPQRRRSARLAMKNGDLSLPVEQSTPVTGKKNAKMMQASKSKPCTPNMNTPTPARSTKWGRRSERPLREYMVLKSAMKFLNTPDSRRYRIGSDEKVQIREPLHTKTDEAIVSDKLLKELHDLYATP